MLVRSLSQATRRATTSSPATAGRLAFFTPNTASAGFFSSARRQEPSVPIVSWSARKRSEHEIKVKNEQVGEVVKPLQGDLQRSAKPLDGKILKGLTPTLSKFTLDGKVAVVTGYVYRPMRVIKE